MDSPANQRWLPLAMFFAIVYPVVGITFAFAASKGMVVFWRLAAWAVCAAAFAVHIWYEHFTKEYKHFTFLGVRAFDASVGQAYDVLSEAVRVG